MSARRALAELLSLIDLAYYKPRACGYAEAQEAEAVLERARAAAQGTDALQGLNPEAVKDVVEALDWCLHAMCGVGKSGDPIPVDGDESVAAQKAGRAALSKLRQP